MWQSHEDTETDAEASRSIQQPFKPGKLPPPNVLLTESGTNGYTSLAQSPTPLPTWSASGAGPYQSYRVDATGSPNHEEEDDLGQDTDYTDLEDNW